MSTVFAPVSHHILVPLHHQLLLTHLTSAHYSTFSSFQLVNGSGAGAGPQAAFPLVSNSAGCKHETIDVEAGKTYRLRLIGASGLTYKTVCFEGQLPLCIKFVS